MNIGIERFQQIAQQPALDRVVVQGSDVVAGKANALQRLVGWVTGSTAKENKQAFEALKTAVEKQYGEAGKQAFVSVGGRYAQGTRLSSAVINQVLDSAVRINSLSTARKAVLDGLPQMVRGSDALAMEIVKLGLLGEGSSRLSEYPTEIWNARQLVRNTVEFGGLAPDSEGEIRAQALQPQPKGQVSFHQSGQVSFYQVSDQIIALSQPAARAAFLQTVPEPMRELMGKRLDQAVDIAKTALALKNDQFKEGYAEGLTKHIMGIRDAGITKGFPQQMAMDAHSSGRLIDGNGKEFDHCRGKDSHVIAIDKYMKPFGLNQAVIDKWGGDQAADSWTPGAQAMKFLMLNQRTADASDYYMGQGRTLDSGASAADLQTHYQGQVNAFCREAGVSEQHMLSAMQAWHALNMEFLSSVELPGNDRGAKTLSVYRTESNIAVQRNLDEGLQVGGQVTLRRGPAESGSLVAPCSVFGNHVTVQEVPHHRVLAGYYFERSPGSGSGTFLNDNEREVLFMPHGIEATYQGRLEQEPLSENELAIDEILAMMS